MSVRLRFQTFIPDDWVKSPFQPFPYDYVTYGEGDNRTYFDPYGSYRTRFNLYLYFDSHTINSYKYASPTRLKHVPLDPSVNDTWYEEGEADLSQLGIYNVTWNGYDSVSFKVEHDVSNGIFNMWYMPSINYYADVTVYSDGRVVMDNGRHDGFPSYEFYKDIGNGWERIFEHVASGDISDLYPPAGQPINVDD
ncbi:hypothetical protein GCM10008986_34860 [Salinibacillus aidingensis]|uniref:Uncharacterized protein n=1 Tax=Salinibacillus aidingensis TaxID=237684 RepID=A0ABN1BS33_9BACI